MTVSSRIDSKVAERAMLSHPFYQALTEGRLPLSTLRDYARQAGHAIILNPAHKVLRKVRAARRG